MMEGRRVAWSFSQGIGKHVDSVFGVLRLYGGDYQLPRYTDSC